MSASTVKIPLGKGLPLLEATFLERPNQFTIVAEYQGERIVGAMADRGRLLDVMTPGRTLLMEHRPDPGRKTAYQFVAARSDQGHLVSLDTHLPNRLVRRALTEKLCPELPAYTSFRAEYKVGRSRFDFMLELESGAHLLLETKSVGQLDRDGVARFPDAPTQRGARHVRELIELQSHEANTQSAVLFVIQGDGVHHMEPNVAIDPDFAQALAEAEQADVMLLARTCPLDESGLAWGAPCPIVLPQD